jgi:N6-adenosine-specific RNA methylase IME4
MTRYQTIVVDPPWEYGQWRSTTEQVYPTMGLDEIRALPVRDLGDGAAHLYCWAVLPLMAEAYDVVRGWGFKPYTTLTWCKPGVGLGGGYRGNTEHLIVARQGEGFYNPTCAHCGKRGRGVRKCSCDRPDWRVKGEPYVPARPFLSTAAGTWYEAPRAEHSAKPELFLDLIERMSPPPRIELFARRARFGWDYWGNESLETAQMAVA